jgi:ribosomal protein S16
MGAQPSAKVKSLLSKAGILKKIHEQKYSKKDA